MTSFIHIDLPIFIGSNVACGYFGCDIEVESLPQRDEPFPWPQTWLTAFRDLFEDQPIQVWGESAWEWPLSEIHFTLFGLVCADWDEARALVRHIERVSGSRFNEHEVWWSAEHGAAEREQVERLEESIEGAREDMSKVSAPDTLRPYTVVRLVAIRSDRFSGRKVFYSRHPRVGDIGAVVEVYEKPDLAYEVECVDPATGTTIWLETMYPDEIEAHPA